VTRMMQRDPRKLNAASAGFTGRPSADPVVATRCLAPRRLRTSDRTRDARRDRGKIHMDV